MPVLRAVKLGIPVFMSGIVLRAWTHRVRRKNVSDSSAFEVRVVLVSSLFVCAGYLVLGLASNISALVAGVLFSVRLQGLRS